MTSTKKGNQWYFGMKAHIGVDSPTNLIHSLTTTTASTHDAQVLTDLLYGDERRVYGDAAYTGQQAQIKNVPPKQKTLRISEADETHR